MQRRFPTLLLLAWSLMFSGFANAQGWWHSPGNADVVTNAGIANTLVVKLVNLTPYDITLKEDQLPNSYLFQDPNNLSDQYGTTAMDPDVRKSFMFAPMGVPPTLPRVPAEAFNNPDYVNTTTKPYNFVLGWDDRDGTVAQNWVTWTIKGVECVDPRCTVPAEDVNLGLFITRVDPNKELTAKDYWHLAKDVLIRVTNFVAILVVPENPLAWKDFILSTGEIAKGEAALDDTQNAGDLGKKWYVAAYPFPEPGSYCAGQTVPCSPSNSVASDAAEANWSAGNAGFTQQEIVVTTELRRGVAPVQAYDCGGSNKSDILGKLGSAPVAVVTVMTLDEWLYATTTSMADGIATAPSSSGGKKPSNNSQVAAAAQLLRTTLQQSGRPGILTLVSIIHKLNRQERKVLLDAYETWRAGQPLDVRHQTMLYNLAVHLRNQLKKEG